MEDFDVIISGDVDENTKLVTSTATLETIEKMRNEIAANETEILLSEIKNSKETKQTSVYTNDQNSSDTLSIETINTLASGINSTLKNLLSANSIILQTILTEGLMGKAYETIYSNINTEYKLNYCSNMSEDEIDSEKLERAKSLIKTFNKKINIEEYIRDSTSITFLEGNYPEYLRLDVSKGDNFSAVIDHYPLTICYPSDYRVNGMNILEFNIDNLKTQLKKTYQKSKKTRKAIYEENIDKEIKNNYPPEVYKAYKDKETYAKLDVNYSGCPRVNTMGRKFGVSPFFKCLKPALVLNNIEAADVSSSKARSKKIIFQKLRSELLGTDGKSKGFAEQLHAHEQAAEALKTNFCLYTAPAYVESLEYVVDESTNEESANLIKIYTSQLLAALGINFVDSEISSFTTATISVEQLMRTINSITRQIEKILEKYYKVFLVTMGIEDIYAPIISIVDTEMMEWKLRSEFAKFAYGTLNASRETAFNLVGLDIEDEKQRRIKENENNYDEIFAPRLSSYNASSDSVSLSKKLTEDEENSKGRPTTSKNNDEQNLDKAYTQSKNK